MERSKDFSQRESEDTLADIKTIEATLDAIADHDHDGDHLSLYEVLALMAEED